MKINELIIMLTNRLTFLQNQRQLAVSMGDVLRVGEADIEIGETQNTLDTLRATQLNN
jgi:hypothetical protein